MAIGNCDGRAYHLTYWRGRFGNLSDMECRRLPQCDANGNSVRLYVGGDFWISAAPGFEYCLDAPDYMPAGGHSAWPVSYDFD